MKLAVYIIDHQKDSDATVAALSQLSEMNSAEIYMLWHDYGTYHTLKFSPGLQYYNSSNDLHNLMKLLLAHPALCSRPGLITPLHAQMLSLLGIQSTTVETFRDELQQHHGMIITESCLLLNQSQPFTIRHHICLRLHSNFHSMIKKASLNLFHIPAIEPYKERLTHDFTF